MADLQDLINTAKTRIANEKQARDLADRKIREKLRADQTAAELRARIRDPFWSVPAFSASMAFPSPLASLRQLGQRNTVAIDNKFVAPKPTPPAPAVDAKRNDDKPMLTLNPQIALTMMATAFMEGYRKYGRATWRNRRPAETWASFTMRYLDAGLRHIAEEVDSLERKGEPGLDRDSGKPIIGHALASLAIAAYGCQQIVLEKMRSERTL